MRIASLRNNILFGPAPSKLLHGFHMADPPTYDESASEYAYQSDSKSKPKGQQRFSICEEVNESRSQHVSALVARLLPQVRDRAQRGLSKSTLLLLPSDQEHGRHGVLVGYSEDEMPVIILLEGRIDTIEFWMQQEAVKQLQSQMLTAVSNDLPNSIEEPTPSPGAVLPKTSIFSRKPAKAAERPRGNRIVKPSARVEALFEEAYFRSENEFGLYETHRSKCVSLTVDVR